MWKQLGFVIGCAACLTGGARADILITYTSEQDLDPTTADIDLYRGDAATIIIDVFPLDEEDHLASIGFNFAGTNMGGGVVVNGPLTLSDFMFAPLFQDPNLWFTVNSLPSPGAVTFFPPGAPLPLTPLAEFDLEVFDDGGTEEYWFTQFTGPVSDPNDSFRVHVLPEPAAAVLLLMGVLVSLRRRRPIKP